LAVKKLTFCYLRIEYPKCTFEFDCQGTRLAKYLNFSSLNEADFKAADRATVRHILAHVGMSYIPHLFALQDFDVVHVHALWLSRQGIDFYENYFQQGLAELRFQNRLDVGKRVRVTVEDGARRHEPGRYQPNGDALLMNGGGKDTAVAGEVLRAIGVPFTWFTVGSTHAMGNLISASGNPRVLTLNFGGSKNAIQAKTRYLGHRPFTSILACMSLLAAFVQRHRYVIVANEYSANFGNVTVSGMEVNHQYPKSHRFEVDFARYVNREILPDVTYFSILRPLYEIQIAKLFAAHPKYFKSFRSCNMGRPFEYWCLACPKCAFILLALAPHLNSSQLITVFGANLFAFPHIRELITALCSNPIRPPECVGTHSESLVALWMARKKHPRDRFIASLCERCCDGMDMNALERQHMGWIHRPHSIPSALAPNVMDYFASGLGLKRPESPVGSGATARAS
jgi:hypothetical protein